MECWNVKNGMNTEAKTKAKISKYKDREIQIEKNGAS